MSPYLVISILLVILNAVNAFDGKITVESKYIFIKYAHELKGEKSGFHHYIDVSEFSKVAPINCGIDTQNGKTFCLEWSDLGKFQITKKDDKCDVYELSTKLKAPLKVRFDTSNVYLYGGFQQDIQTWPADFVNYDKYSYVTKERNSHSIMEAFWLVSNGMYLYVDRITPLFISQNKNKHFFELIASKEAPFLETGDRTVMKYTLCKLNNVKEAQQHAIQHIFGNPTGIPDERMIRNPVWSTWAKYKYNINTAVVLDYATKIIESGLPNSQLEIDDKWETCYGSLIVDKNRFSDMKDLVEKLKNMGFRTTLWVHPYVQTDCQPYFQEAVSKGYLVKDTAGSVNTKWWNGIAGLIDFTNPEAVTWFKNRLKALQTETGLDSFKFDSGESSFAPQLPVYKNPDEDYPDSPLKYYVQTAVEFGAMAEVRSARATQKTPIFLRMIDRESIWEGRLGLSTFIPTLLMMNVIGYPFVLPDMVGGNKYQESQIISEEMFVRWLQANVFMPSIQFSFLPSDYGERAVRLTKKFIDLHIQYSDKIIESMKNSVKHGSPVNPPIWWIDPTDPETYLVDSEFLLGEDILVAPVLQQGAESRDIYLPKGYWRDEVAKDGKLIKGPVWLYNYPADLEVLPYFTKVPAPKDTDDNKEQHDDKKSGAGVALPTLSSILIALIIGKLFDFRF